jgi:hypothetical protein
MLSRQLCAEAAPLATAPPRRRIRCDAKFKFRETNAFVLQHRQTFRCKLQAEPEEVTMPAIADTLPRFRSARRVSDRPVCLVCADTMVAAEASAFVSDNVISHLWSCETCGYGFVTKHSLRPQGELSVA